MRLPRMSQHPESPETCGSIIELLNHDGRPSFVVDLDKQDPGAHVHMPVIYYNPALAHRPHLCSCIRDSGVNAAKDSDLVRFRQWVMRAAEADSDPLSVRSHAYHDIAWTTIRLQSSYLIVSGLPREVIEASAQDLGVARGRLHHVIDHDRIQAVANSEIDSLVDDHLKCTNYYNKGMLRIADSADARCFHETDWASTSLGPMENWSGELHQLCNLVMADPEPALVLLGDELVVAHNSIATQFFPPAQGELMGNTIKKVLPDAWTSFEGIYAKVKSTKRAQQVRNIHFLLKRADRLDEAYISSRYMPILDRQGRYLGIYQNFSNVTQENLSRRRLATLLDVSTCASNVSDDGLYWTRLMQALSTNVDDVGFALLYSLKDQDESKLNIFQRDAPRICTLEGALNVPKGHVSAPTSFQFDEETEGYCAGFRQALEKDAPVFLRSEDGTLPPHLPRGLSCRAHQAPCHVVVICPIRPTGGLKVVGFLTIGVSSRVVCDGDYQQFIGILNRQIATSMASITLFSDEIRRERSKAKAAALVHAHLQERLEKTTQDLLISEAKFSRMADTSPVGMTITNRIGKIVYANEAFYKITGHLGTEVSAESWIALVHEDDVLKAMGEFEQLWLTKTERVFEIRMKKEWVKEVQGAETIRSTTWILASAKVELDSDGEPLSLFSSLTDISAQKWAEEAHRRRMLEALEVKRQQESFIDTISHEIRNPLSAILQSTDEIADFLSSESMRMVATRDALQNGIDAVQTIMLCCQHQRRVVDDVLTLSKLNSDMLLITPDDTCPQDLVSSVVRMFSGEAKKHGIAMSIELEASMQEQAITTLLFDASRLSQVLVNLLGNAVKFTRDAPERRIRVLVGTSTERPGNGDHGVEYTAPLPEAASPDLIQPRAEGRRVYLRIVVQDTGIGMRESEQKQLFQRFTQASPRTHVRYGGSGLGLFISKKLCQLQDGAIGLKMGDGLGSTFACYISTWQSGGTPRMEQLAPPYVNLESSIDTARDWGSVLPAKRPTAKAFRNQQSSCTLLVVEDNLINQKVMCRQLRNKGYTVFSANNGAEALEFLETTVFWKEKQTTGIDLSLVLLDVEMPVMDGLTCIRRIRQWEDEGTLTGHVPVISVTANARDQQIQEGINAGMDDNVSKPFQMIDLIPKIEALVGQASSEADAI